MAELGRGAKAGAVSGVIYGPVNWLIINVMLNIGIRLVTLGHWIASFMEDGMWVWVALTMNTIIGAIIGLMLGLVFAACYGRLPGRTSTIKGIVTSILHWITILWLSVLLWVRDLRLSGLDHPYPWQVTAIGLGTSMIWGWLLGHFWDQFCPSTGRRARPNAEKPV